MATVALDQVGDTWAMNRIRGIEPFESSDSDTNRIWWTERRGAPELDTPRPSRPESGGWAVSLPLVAVSVWLGVLTRTA